MPLTRRRAAAAMGQREKESYVKMQETTPENRGTARPPIGLDGPCAPNKKHFLEDEHHLSNTPRKKTCTSLQRSRRQLALAVHPVTPEASSANEHMGQQSTSSIGGENSNAHDDAAPPPQRSTRLKVNLKVKDEETLESDCSKGHQQSESSTSDTDSDQEQNTELSAYERKRLKNIKANAKFLNSIKLLESVASLRPPPKKALKRGIKSEKPPKTENTVVRRSMRLQRVDVSGIKLPDSEPVPVVEENPLKPPGPMTMVPINNQENHEAVDKCLTMWSSISQETLKRPKNKQVKDLKRYEDSLKRLRLREEDVAKVVPHRIFSVAVHPSESRTLVATGDKWGNVGLWDLDDKSADDGVYVFALHSRPVGCLSFSPSNPAHLLSISYDGTLRCGDVTKLIFDEVVRDVEESLSSFDYVSTDGSVLIVSHWDSQLSLVDRRTPNTSFEQQTSLSFSTCRTVSVHPLKRDICVVAGTGGAAVYDVRKLHHKTATPVVSLAGHTKSVASAYFSPVTGNRILTTCADDRLRVFDSSSLGSELHTLTSIRHNNNTGRWLTRFRAEWDPKQEDCFVVGSMARPRQIEVFHESGELVHFLWDAEYLSSVCSINAIHPSRNVVVCGNSSGRLHVFRN